MLKFPDNRRVPPPDLDGTARQRTSSSSVRAFVRSGARRPPREHAFFVMTSPHEPQAPRTLVFAEVVPPPGDAPTKHTVATGIRAIAHPRVRARAPERTYYPPRDPQPASAPRRLHFADQQITTAVISAS